jgi:hypothetical protein
MTNSSTTGSKKQSDRRYYTRGVTVDFSTLERSMKVSTTILDSLTFERERVKELITGLARNGCSNYKLALMLGVSFGTVAHWGKTGRVESGLVLVLDRLHREYCGAVCRVGALASGKAYAVRVCHLA